MDDPEIYVEHGRLEAAAGRLRTHKSTFDTILTQLEADLAPMVTTWSGEARDLYMVKKANWDAAAKDLTALLGQIAVLTENAFTGYCTDRRRRRRDVDLTAGEESSRWPAHRASPRNIKISELKSALQTLQDIQYDLNNPPADSFDAVGDTINQRPDPPGR